MRLTKRVTNWSCICCFLHVFKPVEHVLACARVIARIQWRRLTLDSRFTSCNFMLHKIMWGIYLRGYVVVMTTAQLYSTKPELRFCVGSNPAGGVLEIRDGEDLWQWFWLEIRLNTNRQSTIPQKQLIIIIIIQIIP